MVGFGKEDAVSEIGTSKIAGNGFDLLQHIQAERSKAQHEGDESSPSQRCMPPLEMPATSCLQWTNKHQRTSKAASGPCL
jgi:hypothetical protein